MQRNGRFNPGKCDFHFAVLQLVWLNREGGFWWNFPNVSFPADIHWTFICTVTFTPTNLKGKSEKSTNFKYSESEHKNAAFKLKFDLKRKIFKKNQICIYKQVIF